MNRYKTFTGVCIAVKGVQESQYSGKFINAYVLNAPKEMHIDGDHVEDNAFKNVPEIPGVYTCTVDMNASRYGGYDEPEEWDVEFVVSEATPLCDLPSVSEESQP